MNNNLMLDYRSYLDFDKIENIHFLSSNYLEKIDWRDLREKLRNLPKDKEGSYIWWHSRSSKDNKVFHESNSICLFEDIEYAEGSGHFRIEVTNDPIDELKIFKSALKDIAGINYGGVFFIGPNSYIEEHTDKNMFNILINLCVPKDSFLIVDNEKFHFVDNQIIMFDGDLIHSASNVSEEDWILFVLRIDKNKFKKIKNV